MNRFEIIIIYLEVFFLSFSTMISDTIYFEDSLKPRIAINSGFITNYNTNSGIYKAQNWNNICCNDLVIDNNYFAFSFEIGVKALINNLYKIPFFDSLSYNLSTHFNYSYNKIIGSNYEPHRKVFWQNQLTDLIEKNQIAIDYSTIYWFIDFELGTPFDSLNYHTELQVPKFYFSIGPVISFTLGNKYEQTLSIIQPIGFKYSNDQSTIKKNYEDFLGFNRFTLGLNVNIDSYWNSYLLFKEQWSKNMSLGIGLRYIYFITSLIRSQNINNSIVALKLNFIYSLPININVW